MAHLGDSHNFGRRVSFKGGRVRKPRTVLWEWLLLAADSPLRRYLDEAADRDGFGREAFGFLPRLRFFASPTRIGGEAERLELAPLPRATRELRQRLAGVVGRSLALASWLGLADLHWENLALGVDGEGRVLFTPLDIEMILAELSLPTETKLLPDADPEYAAVCQHASGVRRALPYLGKPVRADDLLTMAAGYGAMLGFLDRHSRAIAAIFAGLPGLGETPIRVCLRGTDEYVHASERPLWPPLLDAELEQLDRGDIPYFFRLYGRPGIHYYGDRSLRHIRRLPLEGDVPQLDPLLRLERGLRAPSRKRLREDGLFTVIGAFDHDAFAGRYANGALEVRFGKRSLAVRLPSGKELRSPRNLRAYVSSVYLPCRCGEVKSALVPEVTRCSQRARRPA